VLTVFIILQLALSVLLVGVLGRPLCPLGRKFVDF